MGFFDKIKQSLARTKEQFVGRFDEAARRADAPDARSRPIDMETVESALDTSGIPDPDLVIRTSGEQRVSNFLTWQTAYSEFVFLPCYWPDFDEAAFKSAIDEYCRRDRRFGGLSARAV